MGKKTQNTTKILHVSHKPKLSQHIKVPKVQESQFLILQKPKKQELSNSKANNQQSNISGGPRVGRGWVVDGSRVGRGWAKPQINQHFTNKQSYSTQTNTILKIFRWVAGGSRVGRGWVVGGSRVRLGPRRGGAEKNKKRKPPAGTTPPAITRPGSFMTPFGVPPFTLM